MHCVNGTTGLTNDVGSESPKGDGKWGQSDLTGNVHEQILDWAVAYSNPCSDCADLMEAVNRAIRGGAFNSVVSQGCRTASRGSFAPYTRSSNMGVRCARRP